MAEDTTSMTARIPTADHQRLHTVADALGTTVSAIVRDAITEKLDLIIGAPDFQARLQARVDQQMALLGVRPDPD